MNELRWILAGFGIVLLAGIYLWGRRAGRSATPEDGVVHARPEPSLYGEEPEPRADGPADVPADDEPPAVRGPAGAAYAADADSGATRGPERGSDSHDLRRARIEPTLADLPTEELPAPSNAAPAPTLSSSDAPQPRRIERRKIIALRLAAGPARFDGGRLLEAFEAESLKHGKYEVFHRLHEDGVGILFSVASMVEPGTFDPARMPSMQFPGVTLFTQLPGPTAGMYALNELIACARKLQQMLGGVLQDDRGVPLTVHRIERLRQEVREFERGRGASSRTTSPLT